MHRAPAPEPRTLLPPLLACLPTAFVSPRPPPALLPLLSPILRQRLSLLSSSSSSGNDGWLPLLSWDTQRASKLPVIIERIQIEPHPVSGEVELEDVRAIKYRQLDEETLQSRLEVEEFELLPIYVWCETDEHGGGGPGWKLAELRSLEDINDGTKWFDSASEASDAADTHSFSVPQQSTQPNGSRGYSAPAQQEEEEEDDGDYWASYDRTPGRTPAQKLSPAPPSSTHFDNSNRQRSQSELEYFARYGTEVQPALDSHDPDEENPELGESTLTGDSLSQPRGLGVDTSSHDTSLPPPYKAHDSAMSTTLNRSTAELEQPRPISPTSSHSSIERLEKRAAAMSDDNSSRAEMGIKQHISTDIKSLFRLARSVGMERSEFERIVRTELDVLSLLENDD